jgi:hypothetical protein
MPTSEERNLVAALQAEALRQIAAAVRDRVDAGERIGDATKAVIKVLDHLGLSDAEEKAVLLVGAAYLLKGE